ncbi:MAG: MerR family transcriptional regulator [Actinomycetota bacterium]|nr:MerR family transcriptional regulator [Actinomycetota bacterium]
MLTIHEAATATGWSPRMLRYVEQLGLVEAPRSPAGHRLYGPEQLRRLRTLRELLAAHGVELGDVAFALRLRREPALATALDGWLDGIADPFDTAPPAAEAPDQGPDPAPDRAAWLAYEQTKHQSLLPT